MKRYFFNPITFKGFTCNLRSEGNALNGCFDFQNVHSENFGEVEFISAEYADDCYGAEDFVSGWGQLFETIQDWASRCSSEGYVGLQISEETGVEIVFPFSDLDYEDSFITIYYHQAEKKFSVKSDFSKVASYGFIEISQQNWEKVNSLLHENPADIICNLLGIKALENIY